MIANKFFWIRAVVIGLSAFAIVTGKAKEAGLDKYLDPRVMNFANEVTPHIPNIKEELIKAGNQDWVCETWMQNQGKDCSSVKFEQKEKDWQLVKYEDYWWKTTAKKAKKNK